MSLLYLEGPKAYTPFRLKQLLSHIQTKFPQVSQIEARYIYCVELRDKLSPSQQDTLLKLLPGASCAKLNHRQKGLSFYVMPRLGTISPWSSKATDIAHICELDNVARIERGTVYYLPQLTRDLCTDSEWAELVSLLYDPLTDSVIEQAKHLERVFSHHPSQPLGTVALQESGIVALEQANVELGLALSADEIEYLYNNYKQMRRDPTDVELMMFAQVNSEHCRHKIFNAQWIIDGQEKPHSLFEMIRHTYNTHPQSVIVAYKDNAAVLKGVETQQLMVNAHTQAYEFIEEPTAFVLKVETHNHPTAISPFPGAATGSGGEIRDEAATGRGARAKAGLCGFSVSHLNIPGFAQPWENCIGQARHLSSALDIMLQAPIGAASFNNEFGRPNICGYFRSMQMVLVSEHGEICRGYHKPIMIAGGVGNIREQYAHKQDLNVDVPIIVLGGPAMMIGLGGGSASSQSSGENKQDLDFASVQRANPEMQRRAQEVIDSCCALSNNPILSIHDVGAGGLSNAVPEIVHASDLGCELFLRMIPTAETGMSPLAIWCNEAQERYVLAIHPDAMQNFINICERERCPFAVIGKATVEKQLQLKDSHFNNYPVDIPLDVLFEKQARMVRKDQHAKPYSGYFDTSKVDVSDAVKRVLQFPCVADKSFLITIGDRSVGGMVARDQMVGPWQVPVADVAVTCNSFCGVSGEAMAMGERAPIALLHQPASARMAVAEAITNIAAADIDDISQIVLSANWMAAADYPGEGAALYDAVQTIGLELCPALGIAIPVGKDSLSMRTTWQENGNDYSVTAPLSLIVTATAKVADVRKTLTPVLNKQMNTKLILIDLGRHANNLGASVLSQVYNELGSQPPDVDDPQLLKNFFNAIQKLNQKNLLLAYHDRSDGGLLVTLCEMMFATHCGLTVNLDSLGNDPLASLFNEELGAVVQVSARDIEQVWSMLAAHNLTDCSHVVAEMNDTDALKVLFASEVYYENSRTALQRWWSETSYRMQALRDNSQCAQQQYDQLLEQAAPGLTAKLSFDLTAFQAQKSIYIHKKVKPKVAILREQGVNGHREMAAAFTEAGFEAVDVHMSDLLAERIDLNNFKGVVGCGGFSYGDVLGAGRGWAMSILLHEQVKQKFHNFFSRPDTFALGVCNGCQMFSALQEIIPGAEYWPQFRRNTSEQFEARLSLVKINPSPSIFFNEMAGSVLPVVVAHGEGRAEFDQQHQALALKHHLVSMQYVDHHHHVSETYPFNPNGSSQGITGLTNRDGRITVLMPHPERVFRTLQLSWHPAEWGQKSPWLKMFYNARAWVD